MNHTMHLRNKHTPSNPHRQRLVHWLAFFVMLFAFEPVFSWNAQWFLREPTIRSNLQPRRSGHVAFHVESIPFVFGGYVEEDTDNGKEYLRYVTNDLWKWQDDQWYKIQAVGDIPRARLVATASVLNNKCYLMGGWDPETQGTGGSILDTVHCWEAGVWSCLPVTMPDGPTSRHVAVSLSDDQRILVHTHRCQGYVLLFDSHTKSFRKQDTTGSCPSSRGLHAATRLNPHQVLFFGGAAQSGTMSDEVFLLNTNTWEWTTWNARGPTARAGACLVRVDDHTAVLFGGAEATSAGLRPRGDVWLLDIHKDRWELLIGDDDDEEESTGETRPPPRNAATLSLLEASDDRKTFLLTGGWHPFVKTYDDCFILKLTDS